MGNTHVKPLPRPRNKKQVHWKAADRPSPPGKPHLASDHELTADLVTIRWTKPLRDGGSPITGYLVEHRRTGSPHWVRATPVLVPFSELTISGLEPGWRYQFRVSAENAVGMSDPSAISELLTVTLQKFAITAPKFYEELQDATGLENERVEFVVHFCGQPAPKICWFKDGFEIFSSRRTRIITENDKSILTIHQSALADEGEIKCTATNKAGHASTKARLALEAPPSIRLPRQYEDGVLFEIGEVIRLKVSVVGRPTPLIFWTHNGETIQNNDRYEIEYVDKCSILKIGEAIRSDRGEYQIKAVNKIGEDLVSFLVTVTDKPSPPGRARVVMTLGRSVTLSWNTPDDDGGCKIGNYIVEYYRLGWNVWLKAATSRQLSTILGDLIEGSEYKFRVKAESPYGVSEPSEESEVIFIPDARRGITTPQARSRSQPKDIIDEIAGVPVAAKRKKPRSQSSTKTETFTFYDGDDVPVPPKRTKPKTPPNLSPRVERKYSNVTETILDRASIARELAYGSPEIKMTKTELNLPQNYANSSGSDRSHSISPVQSPGTTSLTPVPPSRTPSPNIQIQENVDNLPSPKPHRVLSRDNSSNYGGSSEFMLVLYPDGHEKEQRRTSDGDFNFDDNSIPPPISLSAPELGAEPPIFPNLRPSASSTELLHERAMMRFREAIAAEEAELEKRRRVSLDGQANIPKIQINSQDDQDIVGLERKHSIGRRLSAGGISQQQAMWAQRRYSLKNANELTDILENKLHKFGNLTDKRDAMMKRQRSESEEKEELEFERVRAKMASQGQSSFEKRSIDVVDEDKWMEEYEESLSEEESESEEDRPPIEEDRPKRRFYSDDEEEELYNPRGMMMSERKLISNEPFEILTTKKSLPDPNLVPKPILKKSDDNKLEQNRPDLLPQPEISKDSPKVRSQSPMPKFMPQTEIIKPRGRSFSLAQSSIINLPTTKSNTIPSDYQGRQRSSSLIPNVTETPKKEPNFSEMIPSAIAPALVHNISAVAQLTGLTAASIVISEGILKKSDHDEAKVVIEHYGDIVRTVSQKKRVIPQNPSRPEPRKEPSPQRVLPPEEPKTSKVFDQYSSAQNGRKSSISSLSSLTSTSSYSSDFLKREKREELSNNETSRESLAIQTENRNYRKSPDKSPILNRRATGRSRADKRGGNKISSRSKTPSKSPTRLENWSDRNPRKSSPSPLKRNVGTSTSFRRKSPSPSPIPLAKPSRAPMLREIMTQTSIGLEVNFSSDSRNSSPIDRRQEELIAKAELKVKGAVDYLTDLAMFVVACWLYLFSNELLAIPVLIIMVYRQLKDEVAKRIPKWVAKRFNKKADKKPKK